MPQEIKEKFPNIFLWSTELLPVWDMSMNEESWGREYKGHRKNYFLSQKVALLKEIKV